ncbi:LysR family transcriptional regulator [Salinactinospora qingdaonensis]|uniref:LysR family transcriptional regulator n=1 Tax=Salinactinospora qingdaonensis TaxID=702744 RepID=A0ABP7G2V5_9ACTN
MGVDAQRLRVLVEVAHAGSLTAAAQRLAFTVPAVSQQLSKLEREVGCALVERGRAGVTLTDTGQVLLAHGERVLGELRDAEAAVRARVGAQPPLVRLGAFPSAGKILVPAALAAFGQAHPHVRLALSDVEPPGGYAYVTSGDIDLLITHRYPGVALPGLQRSRLRREKLLVDPLLLVVPADHPAAAGPEVGLAELADQEWICGAPGVPNRVALDSSAGALGVELKVAYETRDYEVALALIGAGIGIGLIPRTIVGAAPAGGWVARSLADVALARDIYLVHRARAQEPVPALVAMLRRCAQQALAAVL